MPKTRAHHVQKRMIAMIGRSRIFQNLGELGGQTDLFIELPQGQKPGIAGQMNGRGLHDNGQPTPKIESSLPSSLYTHIRPPFAAQTLSSQQVRRDRRPLLFGLVNNPG